MLVKTKAIVISALRYQEQSLIVKCFTLSEGLKTYFVRSAFGSKKITLRAAYFQPLTLLEIEAVHKNKGTLEHLKEVKIAQPYYSVYSDIVKSTMAVFLAEVLHHSIREEEKNEALFRFLETAFLWLDTHDEVVNFHLILMLHITKFLGFYPDKKSDVFPYFEMQEGEFTPYFGLTCLGEYQTVLLKKLMELKWDTSQKIFTSEERYTLLTILIEYYSLHLGGFKKPKSLDILKEVFS